MSEQRGAEGATDQSDLTTAGDPGFDPGAHEAPHENPAGPASGADDHGGDDDLVDAGGDDSAGASSPGGARARNDRALIRRVATKTEALRRAPKDHSKLLAAMLGVDASNLVDLTVAVMTADRQALTVGRGLIELAAMDQMELAVAASGLERSELRKLWAFAAEAGADLGTVPAADAKAALAFARAVAALDKGVLDKVAAAIELGRKT